MINLRWSFTDFSRCWWQRSLDNNLLEVNRNEKRRMCVHCNAQTHIYSSSLPDLSRLQWLNYWFFRLRWFDWIMAPRFTALFSQSLINDTTNKHSSNINNRINIKFFSCSTHGHVEEGSEISASLFTTRPSLKE